MPPPFPPAHACAARLVRQAPRQRTPRHRSGSSPTHRRQGTEPPRCPRLDGYSALGPAHRNEKHLLGSESKLLPSQVSDGPCFTVLITSAATQHAAVPQDRCMVAPIPDQLIISPFGQQSPRRKSPQDRSETSS